MNKTTLKIELATEVFYLLPEKAVFRPSKKQLILSDLHLGKSMHFRKNGIQLPVGSHAKDFETLEMLIAKWQPSEMLFLGDLFHSEKNSEWDFLKNWFLSFKNIQFTLVLGNHDILEKEYANVACLNIATHIEEENFYFSHHPIKKSKKINLCGHLHPGYSFNLKANQKLMLPCFYFYNNNFVLPAFGKLTGLASVKNLSAAVIYMIVNSRVYELK
jgi:uncharacterized protein